MAQEELLTLLEIASLPYIARQKDNGRTWLSLAREIGKSISTIRDRYYWYNQHGGASCQ